MGYPEESVIWCPDCEREVPPRCFWRGRGVMITSAGDETRTWVLYSLCPECGLRQSAGLEGPAWYRALYGLIWRLRYPRRRPPRIRLPEAERRRMRAAGE